MNGRDMRERLAVEGAEPAPGSPGEFGKHIAREIAIWAKVVKAAGVN
jgi:tripartite-type tricarboxylate transporter receptor subunit TctC